MATNPTEGDAVGNLNKKSPLSRHLLLMGAGFTLLSVGLLALCLALPSAYGEEDEEGGSVFEGRPIVRQLRAFKDQAGPIVPKDPDYQPWAHHFRASKQGTSLDGDIWFEGNQLVVNAVLEAEGQDVIPQNMKLWTPDGKSFNSRVQPTPSQQEVAPADPSEPPVNFSFGVGFSAPVRRRRKSRSSQSQSSEGHHSSGGGCTECPDSHSPPPQEPHHESESRPPRFTPRVGITFTPTAQRPTPPPPTRHRFPGPPCPRRLKGYSIGTTASGPGRSIPLVAILKEPPGAFARTAPCQILVVMSFPPGEKGAQKTMTEIAQAQGMTFVRSFSLPSVNTLVALMEVSGPTPLANFLPNLQSLSQVQYAQPNQLYRTTAYNDPLSDIQYGPRLIDADRAHQVATGQDVSVAIIDTSIDGDQPDLRGKVIEQIDFIGPDAPGLEGIHGTLMSGVISAGENNQVGGFGVAPHVKLLGLKACQPLPENPVEAACSSESIAKSLDLAIRRKVRLINMSLGGPPDRLIETLIKRAAEKDIIMVAAAGNEGPKAPPSYPAAYEPVLAVSAVDLDDERYDKANVGSYIDLSAPGVDILSTLPGERFNVFSGTSIATAHVTAAAALLLQAKPELSSAEVVQALEETAVDLGRRGRDSQFGAGRINACRALEKVTGTPICP